MVTSATAALMLKTVKYFITFITPKCFALAVAAVSSAVRVILLKKSEHLSRRTGTTGLAR